jgi:hypothetical protein
LDLKRRGPFSLFCDLRQSCGMLIGNSDGNSSAHTLPPMVYFIIQCNRIEAEKQPLGVNTVGFPKA